MATNKQGSTKGSKNSSSNKVSTYKIDALLKAILPEATLSNVPFIDGPKGSLQFSFYFERGDSEDKAETPEIVLVATVSDSSGLAIDPDVVSGTAVVPQTLVSKYLSGVITLDELCQSVNLKHSQSYAINAVFNELNVDATGVGERFYDHNLTWGASVPQEVAAQGSNIETLLVESLPDVDKDIPEEYRIRSNEYFVPDKTIVTRTLAYLAGGAPCVTLIGPTGSGKSETALYVANNLHSKGFAAMVVDAKRRTEGDRLFERDDFDSEGSFIMEGSLLEFARKTKACGLRGLIVLEEYNSFSDKTRREFYRLFNDNDRYYQIESVHASKDSGHRTVETSLENRVDFSHIQFVITANPVGSHRYLTDDLNPLSNAEARRMVMIYQDYVYDKSVLRQIFEAITHSRPGYHRLLEQGIDLDETLAYDTAITCFRLLNRPEIGADGIRSEDDRSAIEYDFGYTDIAAWIWTAALRGGSKDAWVSASVNHLITPVPNYDSRRVIADRLQSKFGFEIDPWTLNQGV